MFGNWGNNNQAQQNQQNPQQPATGLFGQPAQQPSAFGAPGFGQASAFGGAAQPSAFGAAAAPNTQQTTSAFGGFGQAAKPGFGATGGLFGQPAAQPAAAAPAFGGFGGTASTFGSTTTAAPATGGLFGTKPPTTSAFGTSLATTQNNGSASPPYVVTQEREGTTGMPSNYQSITAMPAYRTFSFEELRMQDYASGRKTAAGAGFGQATGFGGTAATPSTAVGAFGQPAPATNAFGQPANTATTGAFGQPAAATGAFGQPAQPAGGFGAFGQPAASTASTGGLFGQNAQQPAAAGAFGQPAAGGAFGGAGAFGQAAQQPATGGLFGNTAASTGAFGQSNAPKPAFGAFGQTAQPAQPTAGAFGTFGQNTTTATTGLFGQQQQQNPQQQQQQQPSAFGGFGQGAFGTANDPSKNAFGATGVAGQPATGLFGQNQQQTQENKPAGFGGFGTGLFGQQQQAAQNPQQPATGLFGNTQPAQQQTQPVGGGLFGGGFGQNNQQQQQPAQQQGAFGNSIFAPKPAQPATGGLFGNTQPQQQTAAPTGTGLFGSAQPNGGLFGSFNNNQQQQPQQQQQQQQPQQNSLFGPKPAGTGLFGSNTQGVAQPSGGLFGNSLNSGGNTSLFSQTRPGLGQQQQQGSLVATVDGNIYNNPLLSAAGGGTTAHIVTLNDPDKGKTLSYSKKYVPKVAAPKVGRLRGFATPPGAMSNSLAELQGARPSSPFNRPLSVNSSRLGTALGGLSDSSSGPASLNPDAFRPRSSVKKLVLPMRLDPQQPPEFGDQGDALGITTSGSKTKVTWDPQLGSAARETNAMFTNSGSRGVGSPKVSTTPRGGAKQLFGVGTPTGPSPRTPGANTRFPETGDTPSKPASALKNKTAVVDPKKEPGEYWTEPPAHELREMGFDRLSHLEGFKVHRTAFGTIEFLAPVNLTTLKSVDDIPGNYVTFDMKECTVYPDESEKPPMGEGLNVKARISLIGCYPTDKATRQLVTDPSYEKIPAHIQKLKRIEDTEFENYEPETGTWTFQVPHFTRYGLDDEDDEEEEEEVQINVDTTTPDGSPVKHSAPAGRRTPSPTQDDGSVASEEMAVDELEPAAEELDDGNGDGDMYDEDDEADVEQPRQPAHRPWPSTLGLNAQRVNVMQASFFHTNATPEEPDTLPKPPPIRNQPWRDQGAAATGQGPQRLLFQPASTTATAPAPAPTAPVLQPIVKPPPMREPVPVKYADSVAFGAEGSFVDAGLSMARSFRVGWGPNGLLTHCGKICGPSDTSVTASTTISIERMQVLSASNTLESERALRLLELHAKETDIEADDDGVPLATPRSSLRFGHYNALFKGDDRSPESSIWRLGSALFDEMDLQLATSVSGDIRQLVQQVRFKAALSDWLESTVSPAVEADLRSLPSAATDAQKVFTMLTGHQVERASEAAMNAGDIVLAMLVCGGDADSQAYTADQLNQWTEQGADAFIDPAYFNAMALVAGRLRTVKGVMNPQAEREVLLAKGLDWKRAFGLYLWYGTSLEQGPEVALQAYVDAMGQGIPKPLPWYRENTPSSKEVSLWKQHGQVEDGIWHLICMAFDVTLQLESVLIPQAFSPSPLDYRLPWHLYVLLSVVLRKRSFGDRREVGYGSMELELGDRPLGTSVCAAKVTIGYAEQLERLGLKEEAVFVLMHLEMAEGRANTIKELLARHAGEWDEDALLNRYLIPTDWIDEANGIRARYDHRLWDAFNCFIASGQEELAHEIALNDIAPEIVIRGDMSLLFKVFHQFTPSLITNWHDRGNLYLQYAECQIRIPELLRSLVLDAEPDATEQQELERLGMLVPTLLESLPKMFEHRTTELRHRVCLADMLSNLMRLASTMRLSGVESRAHAHSSLLPEQTRLRHVQDSSMERFMQALEVA